MNVKFKHNKSFFVKLKLFKILLSIFVINTILSSKYLTPMVRTFMLFSVH